MVAAAKTARMPPVKLLGFVVSVLAALVSVGVVPPATTVAAPTPTTPLVRIPFPAEDGSLTPYTFQLGYPLVTLIYDTLLWRDARGMAQPWLARSITTSSDGKTVTARLADGVRWQDGTALTAADVAFTFNYMVNHYHPRFTPELEAMRSVQAADATTVVFSLRHPSPGFSDQPLADVPIVPAHLWSNLPAGQLAPDGLPVGSGPYRLVAHTPGQEYRFETNSDYFRGPPAVQTIDVPIMTDAEKMLEALEQNRVDMVPVSLPPDQQSRFGLGYALARGTSYLGKVIMFNLRRAPFDRPEVRQALAKALDLDRIRLAVGTGVAANHGYLDPASPWAPADALHTFDESAARSALARLSLPLIDVAVPDSDPLAAEAGRQVTLAWQRVGVQADVVKLSQQALSHSVGEDGSAPSFSVALWSTPPLASYDPDGLRFVFGSDPKAAPLNFCGYHSPAFDAAAAQVAMTSDPAARKAAVRQELQLLATDVPVVPLFFPEGVFAYRPGIYANWVYVDGTGVLDKRSFVASGQTAATTTVPTTGARGTAAGAPVASDGHGGGPGLSPVGWAAIAAALGAVALAAVALVRRR